MTGLPGVTITYAVRPAPQGSRLVAVVRQGTGRSMAKRTRAQALAWGDLVMMRRQLHTFRDLAEAGAVSE